MPLTRLAGIPSPQTSIPWVSAELSEAVSVLDEAVIPGGCPVVPDVDPDRETAGAAS